MIVRIQIKKQIYFICLKIKVIYPMEQRLGQKTRQMKKSYLQQKWIFGDDEKEFLYWKEKQIPQFGIC